MGATKICQSKPAAFLLLTTIVSLIPSASTASLGEPSLSIMERCLKYLQQQGRGRVVLRRALKQWHELLSGQR